MLGQRLNPPSLKGPRDGPGLFGKGGRAKSQSTQGVRTKMNLKKILLSFGAAAAVAALATGGTFAVFTDSQAIGGNAIDSGTVSVQLNDSDTASQFLSVSNMVIGDSKTGTLEVAN